jgi:hypothetical protein
MSRDYDLATVRGLLLAAFTPEELRRFCQDRAGFRPVVKRFGPGQGHDDMVNELLTYCETYVYFDELLDGIRRENPRQYARFLEPDVSGDEMREPREGEPKILTIDSPITLHLVRVPAGEFQMGRSMLRPYGWGFRQAGGASAEMRREGGHVDTA